MTVITYTLPQPALVTLSIFNLVGREIKKLVQTYQPAGAYQVAFDGNALVPGVYFYALKAGGWSQTRKMVVLD
jgi:hypothetical protein